MALNSIITDFKFFLKKQKKLHLKLILDTSRLQKNCLKST